MIFWIIVGVAIVVAIIVALFLLIRVANGNEALVVSGVGATDKNGNPTIKRAGGRVVLPFIQKAKYFDLCVRTAKVEGDVTKTQTGVPIRIDWAVAYSPDISSEDTLQRAVCNFLDKKDDELQRVILDVVSGGVRAVIAKMTPEQVMNGKDQLDEAVKGAIEAQMKDLGFNAILSIHEVEDAHGSTYYQDLAAKDRETKRREAANITAENDQQIRETKAETDRIATEKELASQIVIAEKQRDTDVQTARFKAETAREQARSSMAGELEEQVINQQLEEKKGAVAVMKAEQANLAAKKQRDVEVTQAETAKQTRIIGAEAEAAKIQTEARGQAEAEAIKKTRQAEAEAEAKKIGANATATAVKIQADAEATATKAKGEAEAIAISAKGKAEAEAIEAKGRAEAEAARALSDAQAANDRINFELQKIEIEQRAKVEIATNVATVMAEVGKNASFYDFGGGSKQESGDLLTRVLKNLPQVFAQANLENLAVNGEEVPDTIGRIASALKAKTKETTGMNVPTDSEVTSIQSGPVDSDEDESSDSPARPNSQLDTDESSDSPNKQSSEKSSSEDPDVLEDDEYSAGDDEYGDEGDDGGDDFGCC